MLRKLFWTVWAILYAWSLYNLYEMRYWNKLEREFQEWYKKEGNSNASSPS